MPQRGTFTFPAPYGTTGVRLTNASDCGGGDCVNYVGYSYWRNINNHVGSDTMLIVLGLDRQRGGGGPTLFSYNKNTGETRNLGPLFSADSPYSWATGEGWYFSASQRNALYMNDGFRLLRYDVVTHAMRDGVRRARAPRRGPPHLADALEQRRPRPLGHGEGRQLQRRRLRRLQRVDRPGHLHRRARATSTSARSTRAAAGW